MYMTHCEPIHLAILNVRVFYMSPRHHSITDAPALNSGFHDWFHLQ